VSIVLVFSAQESLVILCSYCKHFGGVSVMFDFVLFFLRFNVSICAIIDVFRCTR